MNKKNFLEIEAEIKSKDWDVFLANIKGVATLGKEVRIDFFPDIIHIYSLIRTGNTFLVFKDITMSPMFEVETEFSYIMHNVSENLKQFPQLNKNSSTNIRFKATIGLTHSVLIFGQLNNDTLEIKIQGGDKSLVNKIPLDAVNSKFIEDPILEYYASAEILKQIQDLSKTKSSIANDKLGDVICVEIQDGNVYLSDSRWKIKITTSNQPDQQFFFKKSFLNKTINKEVNLKFYDKFLIIEDTPYRVIVVLELNDM